MKTLDERAMKRKFEELDWQRRDLRRFEEQERQKGRRMAVTQYARSRIRDIERELGGAS